MSHIEQDQTDGFGLFQRRPSPLALCKASAKNDAGGQLLHQLLYRFQYVETLIWRNGKQWAAQPVRCWYVEVGFSKHKYDAAIRALEKAGLIEVGLWQIKAAVPNKITHIRPTAKGLAVLAAFGNGRQALEKQQSDVPETSKATSRKSTDRLAERGSSKGNNHGNTEGKEKGRETALDLAIAHEDKEDEEDGYAKALAEERKKSGISPDWNVGQLVERIRKASDIGMAEPTGVSLAKYHKLMAAFDDRARTRWRGGKGHRPIPPELALELAVSAWPSFRYEWMPKNDYWSEDFVPGFVLHKARRLYDALVEQRDAPAPQQAHATIASKFKVID